jgi:N-acetyltransferase 10
MQSPVTGEHTCMMLKPINNDDIEVAGSSQCGFLEPFYQGNFLFYFLRIISYLIAEMDTIVMQNIWSL